MTSFGPKSRRGREVTAVLRIFHPTGTALPLTLGGALSRGFLEFETDEQRQLSPLPVTIHVFKADFSQPLELRFDI